MAVGEGGSNSSDFSTGFLAARRTENRSEKANAPLYVLRGGKNLNMTKGEALVLRTKALIDQNPPRKSKESE